MATSSYPAQKIISEVSFGLRVFLAAPLFSEAERDFNSKVVMELRRAGFEVWLAQEHKFLENESAEQKRAIFEEDIAALEMADVVLAVLDGVDVDTGVAFEMGYAAAIGKHIFGLKTDHREFSKIESVNLMLEAPLRRVCRSVAEAITSIRESKRKLRR